MSDQLGLRGNGRGGRGRGRRGREGRGGRVQEPQVVEEPLPSSSGTQQRGRGGRGCRGRRGKTSDEPLELQEVRAQRQLTQRRLAGMPAEVRKELIERKRQAQLQRVLLPNAPPRKRNKLKPSPERDLIEFSNPGDTAEIRPTPAFAPIPPPPTSGIPAPAPTTAPEVPAPSPATAPEVPARTPTVAPAVQEPGREVELGEVELEQFDIANMDVMFVGEEVVVSTSTPEVCAGRISQQRISIGAMDNKFESVIEDWMNLSDSDDDLDIDLPEFEEAGALPSFTNRDAASEPACVADLTPFQAEVLSVEDDQNDRVVHDIASGSDNSFVFDWKKDRAPFTGVRETFTGTSGPTTPVTDQTTVLDVFDRMFDTDLIDRLCTETNRYASQKIALLREQNKLLPSSRLHRWTPTNRHEMISYLAVTILQGLYPVPEEESYFSFNGFGTMPYFSRIMSYNRYSLLKSLLHFVDNDSLTDSTDKLFKIRPILDYLNDKFSALYMPAQEIAIDESLLKWCGRLSFAQKIATKAAQVGIKTYELCESSSGYLWKFFVYQGKKQVTTVTATANPDEDTTDRPDEPLADIEETTNSRPLTSSDARPSNATAKIVYDLVEPLLHRGHTLIMDNFYNSPLLLRCLKKQKTDCYGTLRLNREFVPDSIKTLTKTDLREGEVVSTYCTDLSLMVWRDANLVSMISTYHHLQVGTREKYNRVAYKPQIVLDYNKSMGGVDRKDQFLSAQPVERVRDRIYYKKLFRRLFSAGIFNCFVIYKTQNPKISHRMFRRLLAEGLLLRHRQIDLTNEPRLTFKSSTMMTMTQTPQSSRSRPVVDHNHFPERSVGKSRFRCVMCALRKKESRTTWKCIECNVHLCIDECFRSYHKP